MLFLSACGGGGNGIGGTTPTPTPTPAAPTGLSYAGNPFTFTVGQAITPISPSVTGTVTSYQATLPAGLQINSTTGVISGTPQQIATAANFQVTASNSVGQASTTLSVAVTNTPSEISYAASTITFTVGVAGSVPPTCSSCGANWSISPALPAGLTIDPVTGTIAGTPTGPLAATAYTVSAQAGNSGTPTFSLTIAVAAAPLVQLGHTQGIVSLKNNGQRLLGEDGSHWVLWDFTSTNLIAQGNANCNSCIETFPGYITYPSDIAGTTFVVVTGSGLEVRSTTDGHLLSTITTPAISWWKLASDGSYVVGGSTAGIYIWNPSGQLVISHTGDYSKAQVFATNSALRVALGAAGAQVIESISISTGTSSLSPAFQGNFDAWFNDGGSFITNVGTVLWVYSSAAVQSGMMTLSSYTVGETTFGGNGSLFWVTGSSGIAYSLSLYTVSSTPSLVATYSMGSDKVQTSGPSLGFLGNGSLNIVDLSGAAPVTTAYTTPFNGTGGVGQISSMIYTRVSATQFAASGGNGVLADVSTANPRYFGYGQALSVAASTGAGRAAIATASGSILYFDTTTNTLLSTISFPATKVALSTDGMTLAAITSAGFSSIINTTGFDVAVYQLPSTTPVYTQPVTASGPSAVALAGNGQVMALDSTVLSLPSGSVIVTTPGPAYLSPDGTLVAASDGEPVGGTTTKIYTNGTLTTAVNGYTLGWIDDSHLLVNNFSVQSIVISYLGCDIYNGTGAANGTCYLPQLADFTPLSSTLIYWPDRNRLLTVATGLGDWTSASPSSGVGAANNADVVFVSGAEVLSEPY